MSKRILSLVLALVMVLGTMGSLVFAEGTGNDKVNELIDLGLVQGYGDGTYGLDKTITRAEVATMLVRALNAETEAKAMQNIPSVFTDMNSLHWANGYVNYAVGKGIISGYPDKTFRPSNEITYAEVAKMLVEVLGGLTDAEKANAVWPTTWLAKAAQLGVFEGVSIEDYSAKAVREKVFEMVYNVYFTKEVGNNTIVKAIVLENYRVETLAKDEVVVELISILQRAQFADESRAEKGDQLNLRIPAKLGDVEDLLGKVVDITLDKNGNVLAIKLDNTYKYEMGSIEFDGNRIILDGTTKYTVELPERYRTSDERIFRTYIDNESYSYQSVDKGTTAELARVTVKNGKVLFIDAFSAFADIAPVAKDIDSKNRVEFYSDAAAGDTDVITVGSGVYVLRYVDGKLLAGSNKDIKANDVIHWVVNAKGNPIIVIVRPYEDAAVEGEFVEAKTPTTVPKQFRTGADVYVKVDDTYYPGYIFEKDPRNMVYSYYAQDGEFDVLDEDYLDVLADFEEEDVVLLLDIFGNVQSLYTESEILASEYALIIDTWGTEFRLLLSDNTKAWFDTDRDTTLVGGSDTRELKVNAFKAGSLVRAYADEDNLLSKLVLMKSTDDNVAPHGDVFEGVTKVTSAAVELEDGFKFVNKNTIVFLNINSGKEAAMSLANFIKNYDQADDLDGYVVVSSRDKGLAEVIVITNGASLKASAAGDTVYGKITYVGRTFLELDNGNRYTASASLLEGLKKGDIVAVVLEKDSDTKVKEIYDPFDADKLPKGYHLAGITFQGTNKGRLVDSEGNEYRIDDAVIFDSYKRGDKLTIVVNDYNNVLFLKKGEYVEPAPKVEEALIGGNKVELKNNAVEVSFYDTSTVIPEIKVTFKEAVKVSAITDENGKVYNTPEQFETAKGWLGYTGDLTQFTKTVTLTGTTKTFADVIAKLGETFKVTVVNEAEKELTITISLKLTTLYVKDFGQDVIVTTPLGEAVLAVKLDEKSVKEKFPTITESDKLLLTIGEKTYELEYQTDENDNAFWLSGGIQGFERSEILNGVITLKK